MIEAEGYFHIKEDFNFKMSFFQIFTSGNHTHLKYLPLNSLICVTAPRRGKY